MSSKIDKKSILFINRVYPPTRGATGRILKDLAEHLAKNGWTVTVLTTGVKNAISHENGVRVRRIRCPQTPRRFFTYFWILWRLSATAIKMKPRHFVVTMTDPPLMALGGNMVRRIKKAKHVHWSQDVYPDLLTPMRSRYPAWIINFIKRRTRRTLNKAAHTVTIGRCMSRHLAHTGCDKSKLTVIPNWADAQLSEKHADISPPDYDHIVAAKPHGEQLKSSQKFKVLYAGNIGLLHPIDSILAAAQILQTDCPDIEFVFAGDGAGFDALAAERAQRNLKNIRFMPYQPLERLRYMMETGDIHIATMSDLANGLLVPSKVYSAMAVHRPCIFVGPHLCEAARMIKKHDAGVVVKQGDPQAIVDAVKHYRFSADEWYTSQKGARAAAEAYAGENALDEWLALLNRLRLDKQPH